MNKELKTALGDEFAFMKYDEKKGSPYRRWGCQCNDGWYELIHSLCAEINGAYTSRGLPVDIIVLQVKEKFAKLRFYYTFEGEPQRVSAIDFLGSCTLRLSPDDKDQPENVKALRAEIRECVRGYEEKSANICEYCGKEGRLRKIRGGSWLKTLCDKCCEVIV